MIAENYLIIKFLHVTSIIMWMAGMLYLPRIYVYHAIEKKLSDTSEIFKIMEKKLLQIIINPAMIASIITGSLLYSISGVVAKNAGWWHVKLTAIIFMIIFHIMLARWRREFANDKNTRSPKFYRIVNEIPTALMIIIIFMVIVKPF